MYLNCSAFSADPWPHYRRLRTGDPSLFSAYLDLGPSPETGRPRALLSASPEPFLSVDTDGDGIWDGAEDRNRNGVVDAFSDLDGDGCWEESEPAGESDPRRKDTDGDLLDDGVEDRDRDGICRTTGTGSTYRLTETCAYRVDTDCDGIADGIEDIKHHAARASHHSPKFTVSLIETRVNLRPLYQRRRHQRGQPVPVAQA